MGADQSKAVKKAKHNVKKAPKVLAKKVSQASSKLRATKKKPRYRDASTQYEEQEYTDDSDISSLHSMHEEVTQTIPERETYRSTRETGEPSTSHYPQYGYGGYSNYETGESGYTQYGYGGYSYETGESSTSGYPQGGYGYSNNNYGLNQYWSEHQMYSQGGYGYQNSYASYGSNGHGSNSQPQQELPGESFFNQIVPPLSAFRF